jgi:Mg/Co/Ni transporter MgtE
LFLLTYILTWVYVSVRATLGPGPITALRVGLLMGFVMAFPLGLSMATWVPFSRAIVLGWMIDLWVGSILATLVSGWLYKES